MAEASASRSEIWRKRWGRFRAGVRASAPFAGGVLAAFAALILYNILFPAPHPLTNNAVSTTVAQALASATPPPAFSEQVFQVIQPSLVLIETKSTDSAGNAENSLGSGVVIDQGGDILTALHVVASSSSIQLTFADGSQSSGQITAKQPQDDIAVVQPDHPPALLVPAVLGNPNAMRIGDEAYVVGNPYGLYSSMSAGVISGFDRSFQPTGTNIRLQGLIQIDAAVNPGNSGGPLLNRYGEVIGIIEGLVNPTDQNFFVGIGFAVPINTAASAAGLPPD
ncbi:MAG TPA: trypsin-like peptidase domain-containing protein [Anaerolineales bacterium]|nr:trypsin-like peptidase domain-containing protein [Anaerolineales bacterium]